MFLDLLYFKLSYTPTEVHTPRIEIIIIDPLGSAKRSLMKIAECNSGCEIRSNSLRKHRVYNVSISIIEPGRHV